MSSALLTKLVLLGTVIAGLLGSLLLVENKRLALEQQRFALEQKRGNDFVDMTKHYTPAPPMKLSDDFQKYRQ